MSQRSTRRRHHRRSHRPRDEEENETNQGWNAFHVEESNSELNRAVEPTAEELNALYREQERYNAAMQKYREEHPEEYKNPDAEQVWKLQWLHRKNPNLGNTSIAEELAMAHGNTRRLKRYVRSRGKQGVPFNEALAEYAEGGPAVEGVGRGPNRPNAAPQENRRNLLTVKNAKKLNLLANYYGEYFDPAPGAYEMYSVSKGRSRKRKSRKSRKTRRT